jgi:hypothetical protein
MSCAGELPLQDRAQGRRIVAKEDCADPLPVAAAKIGPSEHWPTA